MAGGFSIDEGKIEEFKDFITKFLKEKNINTKKYYVRL